MDGGDLHEALEQHAAHQRTQIARRRHDGLADHLLVLPRLQQVLVDRDHLLLRHHQSLPQKARPVQQHLGGHVPGLAQEGGNVNGGSQGVRLGESLRLVEVQCPTQQVNGRRVGGGMPRRRRGVDSMTHALEEALGEREGVEGEEDGRVILSVELDDRAASGAVAATQDGASDAAPGTLEAERSLDGVVEDAQAGAAQHEETALPLPRDLDVGEGDAVDGGRGEFPGVVCRRQEDDLGVEESTAGWRVSEGWVLG